MNVKIIYFTDNGRRIAEEIAGKMTAEVSRCTHGDANDSLSCWTERNFQKGNTLIFVGAAGIAVRAIAPFIQSKTEDPAVLVVDELGLYVIPILSGHLGGANKMAKEIAQMMNAQPILTTATDINGVFAIDDWAREMRCEVAHKEKIKEISSALLRGEQVGLYSDFKIEGTMPKGLYFTAKKEASIVISVEEPEKMQLGLIPKIITLGIGCRKGISEQEIEKLYEEILSENHLCSKTIKNVCSIDLKKDENGLIEFCRNHALNISFFSAEELKSVEGDFTGSTFVEKTVGVDNVCERSAVLGSFGKLILKKKAENGVTMALAMSPCTLEWS